MPKTKQEYKESLAFSITGCIVCFFMIAYNMNDYPAWVNGLCSCLIGLVCFLAGMKYQEYKNKFPRKTIER